MTSADRPTAPAAPRAAGVRLSYELLPAAVRSWAEELLGAPVVRARTQVGGMSPGCAVRLTAADGTAAFLKAVSSGQNPDTPTLFRHEITVQRVLPRVTYRPAMIASYDDGDWVGMLLEDVEGRYPDFSGVGATSAADTIAVWSTVRRQARDLTPAPAGLSITTAAQTAQRWAERWRIVAADPQRYLPGWAAAQAGLLLNDHVLPLPASLAGASLCHWDVRNDNLLIRPGGEVVIFDWGMARIGPAWADEFVLSLEWAGTPAIDDYFAQITRDHGVSARMLTDMLIGLVGSLAWRAGQPPQPGLPNMAGFADDLAGLLLAVIRRRLPAP
jgi:Phosphotransferase enzyme family